MLAFAHQWVLPLLAAVVAGDIFANEDQHGTWKTILTRSVSRTQVFWAKTLTVAGFNLLVLALLAASTITTSLLIVGTRSLPGLSDPLGMVMQLLSSLGGLNQARRLLLTPPFEACHGLRTAQPFHAPIITGALVSAGGLVACVALAYLHLRRRDITGG